MRKLFIIVFVLLVIVAALLIWNFRAFLPNQVDWTAQWAIWTRNPAKCATLPLTESIPAGPNDGKGRPHTVYTRDLCLSYYLHATADTTTCDHMTEDDHRHLCFDYLGHVLSDPLWCDKAWSSALQNIQCKAQITGDITLCDAIDALDSEEKYASAKAYCISAVAYTNREYTQCLAIDVYREGDGTRRNSGLLEAICDKPELRQEVCDIIDYTDAFWHQTKEMCLNESGFCPDLWASKYAVPFKW